MIFRQVERQHGLAGVSELGKALAADESARERGGHRHGQHHGHHHRHHRDAASRNRRFLIFLAFVLLVFLTGGGSRDDVASLVVLRPAAVFFAAYALTVGRRTDFQRVGVPLALLLALGVWMAIQLIPLPPALWQALPGRGMIAELDRLAGIDGTWRPISLSPSKTLNALASLTVPVAGLMLYAVLPADGRRRIPALMLAVALASVALGLGQLATGGHGALYLYSVTNEGNAVGLFANRNHHAVFLAAMIVFLGYLADNSVARAEGRQPGAARPAAMLAAALFMILMLLVLGSRAGLVAGVLALGFAGAYQALAAEPRTRSKHSPTSLLRRNRYLGLGAAAVGALAALGLMVSRSTSIDRLMNLSLADELRVRALEPIANMAWDHWIFGIGFGAFEHVYRGYETSAVLQPQYLNNAHDDWLQWIIEGGVPAIAIAAAFLIWLGRTCHRHWKVRRAATERARVTVCAAAALMLLLVASLLDYPLRVPSLMLYAVLLIAMIADQPESPVRGRSRASSGDG